MSAKYTPSFLVSEIIPDADYEEVKKIAKAKSKALKREVTPEEVIREAISFYTAKCVHTQKRKRRRTATSKK